MEKMTDQIVDHVEPFTPTDNLLLAVALICFFCGFVVLFDIVSMKLLFKTLI